MTKTQSIPITLVVALGLTACSSAATTTTTSPESPESPVSVSSDAPSESTEMSTDPTAGITAEPDTMVGVWVDDDVVTLCNIPEPRFNFDSAKVKDNAEPKLDALVECMTEGKLAGKTVQLVGHADVRGTAGYNEGLGMRRAQSIAEYLKAHGVKPNRVDVSSMGEALADPADGNADDRRVQIKVANKKG